MSKSHWDGSQLPMSWAVQPSKIQAIAYLQGRTLMPPYWWTRMTETERRAVVLHLCAVGSVNHDHVRVRQIGGKDALSATHAAALGPVYFEFDPVTDVKIRHVGSKSYVTLDESTKIRMDLTSITESMLYPKPNGGKRILPSVYTKLKHTWLRANGQRQAPITMNQGHLKNTVALLNESHVNLVDRMTDLLGRMHNHLGNRPDLQAKIVDLFHDFEILQVDELYPIVELLASLIEPEPEIDPADLIEDDSWIREF
jgi:hypothetical protein